MWKCKTLCKQISPTTWSANVGEGFKEKGGWKRDRRVARDSTCVPAHTHTEILDK